jgi:hypothetical protein
MSVFGRTWAESSIVAPFWSRNTPTLGRLRTQYIFFLPDRPTLQIRGWTGNWDITSNGLNMCMAESSGSYVTQALRHNIDGGSNLYKTPRVRSLCHGYPLMYFVGGGGGGELTYVGPFQAPPQGGLKNLF